MKPKGPPNQKVKLQFSEKAVIAAVYVVMIILGTIWCIK